MRLKFSDTKNMKYYYALSRMEARFVRILGIVGLLSLICLVIGVVLFIHASLFIALVMLPFFTILTIYLAMHFMLMIWYPYFDLNAHKQLVRAFKDRSKQPRVAVLIPAAGEDVKLVRKTVKAALKIKYPNFSVHILDDTKNGLYQKLAAQTDAVYFRRENTGFEKKAGNLNQAIAELKGYDFCLVLDADFVPRPEILAEMVPYAKSDVGVVQSPQHFDLTSEVAKRSKIEYGAALIQRDFYRIVQPARNRFGAAMCVGTNALYSIPALRKVGGFRGVGRKEWAHAEDVYTGLQMINTTNKSGKRYKIDYVPIQLAKGLCPPDQHSFYKQQNRWASGSMQLIFSKATFFSVKLSFLQKLLYVTGPIYYLYVIGFLFTPVQLLVLLLSDAPQGWGYTLLFLPVLLVANVIIPIVMRQPLAPIASGLVTISNAYTFLQALILLFIRRPLGWEASGAKGTKKSQHFFYFKLVSSLFFIVVYVATLAVLLLNDRIGFNSSTLLVGLFLMAFITHIAYLYYLLVGSVEARKLHIAPQFYAYVGMIIFTIFVGFNSFAYSKTYDVAVFHGSLVVFEPIAKPVAKPAPLVSAPVKPMPIVIEITAEENDSQSQVAARAVMQIRATKMITNAQAGKMQDAIMRELGYSDELLIGTTYRFDEQHAQGLLAISYVFDNEFDFWNAYSYLAAVNS